MAAVSALSFILSWNRAREDTRSSFLITEEVIMEGMGKYLSNYQNLSRRAGYFTMTQNFLLSDDARTVIFSSRAANGYVADILNATEGSRNILLYAENGRYISANGSYTTEIKDFISTRHLSDNAAVQDGFFDNHITREGENLLLYIFPVYSAFFTQPVNSVICVIVCDLERMVRNFTPLDQDKTGAAIILFNDTYVASNRELREDEAAAINRIPRGQTRLFIGSTYYYAIKVSFFQEAWDFVYIIPEWTIFAKAFASLNSGLLLLYGIILILIVLLIQLARSVNRSICEIVESLNALEYGKEAPPYHGPHLKEIESISNSVTAVVARLNKAFQAEQQAQRKIIETTTALAKTESAKYRAQINPHFLFNTLECMRAMAHDYSNGEMENLISSMASMFRYSLYAKAVVPLAEELAHVSSYVNVMNIRSSGKYNLTIITADGTEERMVLSMILQPLVENAIYYGFTNHDRNQIAIRTFFAPPGGAHAPLVIQVFDNGAGIPPELLEKLNDKIRIAERDTSFLDAEGALCNICRRMKLSFGEGFQLSVHSKQGFYTAVEIIILERMEFTIAAPG
jgi:two-component system sensor histidine kinase YesM